MATPDLTALRIDRERAPRPARGGWLAFLLLVALVAGYLGWRAYAASADRRPEVTIGRVQRVGGAAAQGGLAANGYVVARRQAALSTDVQGRLVELRVQEGDRVKTGDLIARIDITGLEATLTRSQAELRQAEASAELARLERERVAPLVAAGYQSLADLDARREALRSAVARVEGLRAAIREVKVQIEKSSVLAPFAGVITAKNAEVGEVVSAMTGSGPNARGSVATLVDFDTLEVQVELAQTSLKGVTPGSAALVFLDAYPDHPYRGRVRQIWPTANREKATVEVRIELVERDDRVLPEMGVRAVFLAEDAASPRPAQVLLPAAALLPGAGAERAVMVFHPRAEVPDAGTVTRQAVVVGATVPGELYVVESGLAGGEQVVLAPGPLGDGAEVRVKREGEESS